VILPRVGFGSSRGAKHTPALALVVTVFAVACSSKASEPERQPQGSDRSAETARIEAPSPTNALPVGSASAAPPRAQYEDKQWGFALSLGPRWAIQIEAYPNGRAVVAKDLTRFIEVIAFPADAKTDPDAAITLAIVGAAKARGLEMPAVDPIAIPQDLNGHDGRQFTFTIAPADRLDGISARAGHVRYILLAHGVGAFNDGRAGLRILNP